MNNELITQSLLAIELHIGNLIDHANTDMETLLAYVGEDNDGNPCTASKQLKERMLDIADLCKKIDKAARVSNANGQ